MQNMSRCKSNATLSRDHTMSAGKSVNVATSIRLEMKTFG